MRKSVFIYFIFIFLNSILFARQFEIDNVHILWKQKSKTVDNTTDKPKLGADTEVQYPHVSAKIKIQSGMPTGHAYIKMYVFEKSLGTMRLLTNPINPIPVRRQGEDQATILPAFLEDGESEDVRFILPTSITNSNEWSGIIVFGDNIEATAKIFTSGRTLKTLGNISDYDFPERVKCLAPSVSRDRSATPLTEVPCFTGLKDYPRLTLFARLPDGIKSSRETGGVLCLSLLADSLNDVRRNLVNNRAEGFMADMLRYADKNKLIIICWGARKVWNGAKNSDELDEEEVAYADKRFDKIATAWENGIKKLADRYYFQPKDFLIWGYCASAQFAHRLVMRKPQYFRAAYLHIPSSFDTPTPEGASVLWCLTAGEADGGYENSLKFAQQCRKAGYPLLFKAVPYLGHKDHTPSRILGMQVFDYARSLPADPRAREAKIRADRAAAPFYCDYLNQVMEPADKADWMPKNLKFPLVTPLLAQAWIMDPNNPAPDPSPSVASLPPPPAETPATTQPPASDLAELVAVPEVKITRAKNDPWADYVAASRMAKKMRAMGMAWDTPVPPEIALPEEHRDMIRQLCDEAEKAYATDLKLAAAMRAAGQSWQDPAKPALLIWRERAAATRDSTKAAPSTPTSPAAPKPTDPDNTVFGRKIH